MDTNVLNTCTWRARVWSVISANDRIPQTVYNVLMNSFQEYVLAKWTVQIVLAVALIKILLTSITEPGIVWFQCCWRGLKSLNWVVNVGGGLKV